MSFAERECKEDRRQQDCDGGAHDEVAAAPGPFVKITGAEKIVSHAACESSERHQNALVEEDLAFQRPCPAEQNERNGRIRGNHPVRIELEVEERDERSRAEIGEIG